MPWACDHVLVDPHDAEPQNFAEMLRAIAHEVGDSIERTVGELDIDEVAHRVGVDPARAQGWLENAASWLRHEIDAFGDEAAARSERPWGFEREEPARADGPISGEDPLHGARPHPLDTPTEEQGVALAALDSGRWAVEPGSDSLAARGEGHAPSDALGLFRELRARDWIAPDGALTLPGRHALGRWLESGERA